MLISHTFFHATKLKAFLISFLQGLSVIAGKAYNITVDDRYSSSLSGDAPVYAPSTVWNQGPQCSGCFVQPDPSQAFGGTWHDSTIAIGDVPYTISYTFEGKLSRDWSTILLLIIEGAGTAVFIFLILAKWVPFATTFTNISFTLDGNPEGTFIHMPDETNQFEYHVNGFTKNNLQNKAHTIVITNQPGSSNSLVLFDYLIYTWVFLTICVSSLCWYLCCKRWREFW